jgi:nitrogen fixation NifU-like protein
VSERIKKLYPEAIKAHNDMPYHFGKQGYTPLLKAYNPVCGDKFEIYIHEDDARIREVYFHGFGCAISKASTSILAKSLEGKKYDEALLLCNNFLGFVNNTLTENQSLLNDDFKSFSALHEFPERLECATLSWLEMRKFMESKIKK